MECRASTSDLPCPWDPGLGWWRVTRSSRAARTGLRCCSSSDSRLQTLWRTRSVSLVRAGKYFSTKIVSQGNPAAAPAGPSDLIEGDLGDVGMNEDDLLGDFGDDFNILEFADALDGNDTKTNILDDLEAEESKEGEKDDAKPPPYPPPQGPPPPYPGPHKVSDRRAW